MVSEAVALTSGDHMISEYNLFVAQAGRITVGFSDLPCCDCNKPLSYNI